MRIQGPYSSRERNHVKLWWEYAHGEPLARSFLVSCTIYDPDLRLLARIDDLEEAETMLTVRGTIKRRFINAKALSINDGGLGLGVYLQDCNVSAIGKELIPIPIPTSTLN